MLEWENQRADMEAEDLVERTKEFQLLRVTKDLQGTRRAASNSRRLAVPRGFNPPVVSPSRG